MIRMFIILILAVICLISLAQYEKREMIKSHSIELAVKDSEIESLNNQIEELILEPVVKHETIVEDLGEFKITHYCGGECCNGPWAGTTALGVKPRENHTIAVDPNVIPLGSKVIIDGIEYTAEDTGGAIKGNRIDIYVSDHEKATNSGVKYLHVYREVK